MTTKAAVIFGESPPLPEDIIFFEIFPRLPVKSLLKFRRVCKFSRSLTSDPQFLAAHRRRYQPRYLLSYSAAALLSGSHNVFINYIKPRICTNPETRAIPLFRNTTCKYSNTKSINGLMCLVQDKHVVIQNLETKEEFKLPYYHPLLEFHKNNVYFCHCPKQNKYKVLISTFDDELPMRFAVFTLGVDKQWRRFRNRWVYQFGRSKSICIDGVLYCTNFFSTSVVNDEVIYTFDVLTEKFRIIRYPKELSHTVCVI